MRTKVLEVRDIATFIPVLAVEVSALDGFLARSAGYGHRLILLTRLNGGSLAHYDPYEWLGGGSRTMHVAHLFIQDNWDDIQDEEVIDVQFILGETTVKKESEQKVGDW